MKKIYTTLISITVIAMMVISCSSNKDHYTNAIPSNASVVLSINLKQIWNKSGFNEQQFQTLIKQVQQRMKSTLDTPNPVVEGIINDPAKSGIDMAENIYIFTPEAIGNAIYVVAKVASSDNFYQTLESLPMGDNKISLTKNGETTIATFGSEFKCAFNANTLVMVVSKTETSTDSLTMQLQGLGKQSINSNPAFQQMKKGKGDIASIIATDKVQGYMMEELASYMYCNSVTALGHPQQIYKDMYLVSNLCFEDGRLHFVNEYFTANSETAKQIEQHTESIGTIGDTFTSKFQADVMAFAAMNINAEKLIDMALKMQPSLAEKLDDANTQQYVNAFKSIDGDIAFGMNDFYNTQSMGLYAQVKNNSILDLIVNSEDFMGSKLNKVSDNEYTYVMKPLKVTIGSKDDQFYVTTSNLNEVKSTEALTSSQWASTISGSSSYLLLNIESAMTRLKPLFSEFSRYDNSAKLALDMLSNLTYMESYYTKSNNQFIVNICAKDKQSNILKTFAKFLPEIQVD